MPLSALTSADAVRQAAAEFDELGRDAFLDRYRFGRSLAYFALIDGKRYDAKALIGAAHGFEHPQEGPLTPQEFSGGEQTVQRKLEELGFDVVVDPTLGQIRRRFIRLATWTQHDGSPAPHKALLALIVLRRMADGGPRLVAPSDVATELELLLRRVLPDVENPSPWEPIWRLEPNVWEVVGREGNLRTDPSSSPPVARLRQPDALCGFISEVYDALVADARWRLRIEDALIGAYLTSVSEDVIAEVTGRGPTRSRVWWVNQGKTYREELTGGYVWAPIVTKRGTPVSHHTAVGELAVGDTIIHYSGTGIRALGRVISPATLAPRPIELPGEPWGEEGRRADVEYFPLSAAIPLSELGERPPGVGPFDSAGAVRQGYLFELPSEWASVLRERFASRWPPGSPWGTAQRWLFQANPRQWDLAAHLRTWKVGDVEDWTLSRFVDDVRDGDDVALFASGGDGGILALGRLDGDPYERQRRLWREGDQRPTERAVNVELVRAFADPITRAQLLTHPILQNLSVLRAPQGTNYRMTNEEWTAVQTLIAAGGDPVEQFLTWAQRFREDPAFQPEEVDYKVNVADRLRQAIIAARERSDGWERALRRAFAAPNNLTSFRVHQPFVDWVIEEPSAALTTVDALWIDEGDLEQRVDQFTSALPDTVPSGPGGRTSLASVLLLAHDARRFPPYRWTPVSTANRLMHRGDGQPDSSGDRYQYLLDLLDELIGRSSGRDQAASLGDRLIAQSALWCVTSGTPVASWDDATKADYLAYFNGSLTVSPPDGVLAKAVARFRATGGYTTVDRTRAEHERKQLADAIAVLPDHADDGLRLLASSIFGYPGPVSLAVTDAIQRRQAIPLAEAIRHAIGDEDRVADRLHAVLDAVPSVHGMSIGLTVKALSTVEPTRWIPYFAPTGRLGTTGLAAALDVIVHEHSNDIERMIEANDAVRVALEPYFGDDSWAMARFLWFMRRERTLDPDALDDLGEELLLGGGFVRDVVELIEDKGQVIFYGPPGTGKTYVALELAYHLTDHDAVELVQFHPSYTYEDFIEGFRPTESGTFLLRPGPLRRFAQAARQDPDRLYILVIDELNRGNVAKVFGELYFLLEYRDREVRLQYSDDAMVLPKNLRFIGTMNSADRSIGLLDGALRRRFHFVSFAPDDDQLKGLLATWLATNAPELTWVDQVVRKANELLEDPHLAIGPSHFLRTDLTDDRVRKIWKHSVLPYIADQFFGREHELAKFDIDVLRPSISPIDASDGQDPTDQPD